MNFKSQEKAKRQLESAGKEEIIKIKAKTKQIRIQKVSRVDKQIS